MDEFSPVPPAELNDRIGRAKAALAEIELDGLVIAVPENIYYLTGLDHWGFFAAHVLVLNRDGQMALCCRAMESVTVANQVHNARFYGHKDHEELSDTVHVAMGDLGLGGARVGMEMRSLFLHLHHGNRILSAGAGEWVDASALIDGLRQIKSGLELDYLRRSARACDLATTACIGAIGDGATDHEVAAEFHRTAILEGSEYPGFGPFIRPSSRLGEEHTTWRGETFRDGEAVFLETCASWRRYQSPMGRLVYVGSAPAGADRAESVAISGMEAICGALKPGATAGDAYAAWHEVAASAGLADYHRHHCGYMIGIGFPPSWTGGSMVTGLAPNSQLPLQEGMAFHAHSWFTNTGIVDYFISNTVIITATGAEILTHRTPQNLIVR